MSFREFVSKTVQGLSYLQTSWGERFVGGAIGLMSDAIAEGSRQAFFQRLPGHPQQAPDSRDQIASDRLLWRFFGETDEQFSERITNAFEHWKQSGTVVQLERIVDHWGKCRYGESFDVAISENDPTSYQFTLTITGASMSSAKYDSSFDYGDEGFFYGYDDDKILIELISLVKQWKRESVTARIVFDEVFAEVR